MASVLGVVRRHEEVKRALPVFIDHIFSNSKNNPNVRVGLIGYAGAIYNKWALTSDGEQARNYIRNIEMREQSFDHWGLEAAYHMITGKAPDPYVESGTFYFEWPPVSNPRPGLWYQFGPVVRNTETPLPVTVPPRTKDGDPRFPLISPLKYVILLTEGGIMLDPKPADPTEANFNHPYTKEIAAGADGIAPKVTALWIAGFQGQAECLHHAGSFIRAPLPPGK